MYHLTPQRLGWPRLLVLEDVAALRIAIMRLLEPAVKLDLMGVSSVPVARESIRQKMPAAILLDLRMAGDSGAVLLREIRSAGWPIRVVIWTNLDQSDPLVSEALSLHPDAFLIKPQPIADLVAALLPAEAVPLVE